MPENLENILKHCSESHLLDFKEAEYPLGKHDKKYEVIKDISAFANHASNDDKYIIIGIKEKNGYADSYCNLNDVTDDSKYQQLVNNSIVPKINFEYREFLHEGKRLTCFRIYNNTNRPYLFSKDLKNPMNQAKVDHREGEGYIRQGTSTRRLIREDFEAIYKERYSPKDRKNDIKIIPYITLCQDMELFDKGYRSLEVRLENMSNRSIDLEASIKIFNTEGISIQLSSDVLREMRWSQGNGLFFALEKVNPIPEIDVDIEYSLDYILVIRKKPHWSSSAFSISKFDSDPSVFFKSLVFLAERSNTIQLEITIRSDDFTDGKITQDFFLEYIKGE